MYESNIFLTLKESTESKKIFVPQTTQIRPLNDPIGKLDTSDLTNNDKIGVGFIFIMY